MGTGGKVLRIGAVAVIVLVAGIGIWGRATEPGEPKFCTLALGITEIDGHSAAIQDGGKPGDDGCETEDTMHDMWVIGLDCKVRASDGEVVRELVPNRDDGLCGRPDPDGEIPSPWPEAG